MRRAFHAGVLSAIFAATAAGSAQADAFPSRKPGGWEVSISRGDKPAATMKMCIDQETDAKLHDFGSGLSHQLCQHTNIKVSGNVVTAESVCTVGSSKVSSTSFTRFDGDTAYHVETKSHFDPPFLGKTDSVTTQEGKWIGDCPAGMKPGDFSMGHGITMNAKTLDALRKRFQLK